jgi:hypothetical protein
LAVIAAEVLIHMLMEAGVTGASAITIDVVGCMLFRRRRPASAIGASLDLLLAYEMAAALCSGQN